MKHAVEMGSDAMICIQSFIETGSGFQKLIGGHTDTRGSSWSHKPSLFFENKESKLKRIQFRV
jgi:hypothetical protein